MSELDKKFLDPNLKNKSKTVEEKIQLFEFQGKKLPLPTEIEINKSQVLVIDLALFVQEVILLLKIKKNLLQMNYIKNYVINFKN